jgi:ABC-type sugar transport system ATPase subunit
MPADADSVISMRDVSHFYGSGALRRQVLFEISCDILPGEIIGIAGGSGSGKSVLLKTLTGLHRPNAGKVLFNGKTIETIGPEEKARLIGVLFQQGALFSSLTVAQNIMLPMREHTAALRKYMDEIFANRSFDARFVPADAGGVRAEWVLSPGADPARRTLYIHGGAFMMGSPRSHRTLTTRFSAMTGGAVLAIDYRLMPEHPRRAGIEDCRRAYRWLLANGPDGAAPAQAMFVAGDSAGGNLTLSLIAWARDTGLRAPDAAVALSPAASAPAILGERAALATMRLRPRGADLGS